MWSWTAMWSWTKVRRATIPDADRELFNRFGENVIALCVSGDGRHRTLSFEHSSRRWEQTPRCPQTRHNG